jgi:hypothetical protein
VDSQFDFLEHETKITLCILIPYSIISNDTIKNEYYSNEEFLSTITVYADHIIENDIYTENSQKVKNGEAYADEIIRTKKFYPYTAELMDMDYTKDLQLDGTEWEIKLKKSFVLPENKSETVEGIKVIFNKNTYTIEKWNSVHNYPYKILKKYIILKNYYDYETESAYSVIQNGRMVIHRLYSPFADYYIQTNDKP